MKLQDTDIKNLASLSRIHVSDEDAAKYAEEFTAILSYVSEIQSVDVPEVHDISNVSNVFREDVAQDTGFTEKFLREVPNKEGDYVKVKQIL
jgi:aspartyl-tRNA(Asn)/glutamyl-tRNA(Gln) amidotransferase subunit C